jgi:hypothetical protein
MEYVFKVKRGMDWLSKTVDSLSTQFFRSKHDEIELKKRCQALAYLNSDEYSQDQKDLDQEEEKIIHRIGDLQINKIYQEWNQINRHREKLMLTNIHQYSLNSKFEKAVFLIGAGHRNSLRDQIQIFEGNGVKWRYFSIKDSS